MRGLFIGCLALLLVMGMAVRSSGSRIAVDFEEQPCPDLSRISNVYHGDATFLYAFLVIGADSADRCGTHVSSYDIGYRLISRNDDIINHGFHRQENWRYLDARMTDIPTQIALPGAEMPAVIGYWKLELKSGGNSCGEFQILPNIENGSANVTMTDGTGQAVILCNEELSQDVRCHGMINQTYYVSREYIVQDIRYAPGVVAAEFMPGVIEMNGSYGEISDILDPALLNICEQFGLANIRRMFRRAEKNPAPRRSRTGEMFTPVNRWDVYVLTFPEDTDIPGVINAILSLPRCIWACPDELVEPTTCVNPVHVPNDTLVGYPWHLDRIGMPCAWDIGIGDPGVKVGVIDAGVDFHLADFDSGFGPGFKIAGGYDYSAPLNPDSTDTLPNIEYEDDCEFCNHGNWMTSALGALTNNLIGVPGVAGGWGGSGEEIGPSLFHFKTRIDGKANCHVILIIEALAEASLVYGCDVVSLSSPKGNYPGMKGAVRDCYRNGSALVAALGNDDEESLWYPACYRDDWVICVQGTNSHPDYPGDPTPERRVSESETPPYDWGADWPLAGWPVPVLSMDVSTPAVNMCYIWGDSLESPGQPPEKPVYRCNGSGVSYGPPQVAGVAALMLSKYPDLIVSDVEGMMGASCTDIKSDCNEPGTDFSGWDKYTGWGRINADTCLVFADSSHACDYHVMCQCAYGGGVIADSQSVAHPIHFMGPGSPSGTYLARRFEVRRGISRPSEAKFVWTTGIEGSGWGWSGWLSDSVHADTTNFKDPYCGLVRKTQKEPVCTLFTYVYKVKTIQGDTLGWYPAPPLQLDWQLRCLIAYGGASSVSPQNTAGAKSTLRFISATPNPARGNTAISFNVPSSQRVTLKAFDVLGREVKTILDENLIAANHEAAWDGRDNLGRAVAPGVYLLRLAGAEHSDVRKLLLIR
jgi:subtilisin family serine protease